MLTVRDIMQPKVVTVRKDASARDLARLLADAQISGVPVLDEAGELVGVVSSTDVVRLTAAESDVTLVASTLRSESAGAPESDEEDFDSDVYSFFLPEDTPLAEQTLLAELPESLVDTTSVEEIMTPVTFSVRPDTPVSELCDFLVRGRIHRAVVVDAGRLEGIVTSADILRAVASGRLST
ncbi:MAG: CBS domain-containing protein [Gemmatimonadota bacterium]